MQLQSAFGMLSVIHQKPDKERTESIYKSLYLSVGLSVCLCLCLGGPVRRRCSGTSLGSLPGRSWGCLGPQDGPLFGSQNAIQIEFLSGLGGPWAPKAFWDASRARPGMLLGSSCPPRWPQVGHQNVAKMLQKSLQKSANKMVLLESPFLSDVDRF